MCVDPTMCVHGVGQAPYRGAAKVDADGWVVRVTDRDIHEAQRRWLDARDEPGASPGRVAQLHEDLRLLIHAQAQQLAEDFRAGRRI